MLALLFRHGVELTIPGPTMFPGKALVTGLWRGSHRRVLWGDLGDPLHLPVPGRGPASASHSPVPHRGVRCRGRSVDSCGADGDVALSAQYGCSRLTLRDKRELSEPQTK